MARRRAPLSAAWMMLALAASLGVAWPVARGDTVGLPPHMAFEREWRLDATKLAGPRCVVARTRAQWAALWRKHAGPGAAAPAVDFDRLMVVGVVAAPRAAGQCVYRVELDDAARPRELLVRVADHGALSQRPTSLNLKGARVHLVATGTSALPVRFLHDDMIDAGVMSLTGTVTEGGRVYRYGGGVRSHTLGRTEAVKTAHRDRRPAAYREQAERAARAALSDEEIRRARAGLFPAPFGQRYPQPWSLLHVRRTPTHWLIAYDSVRVQVSVATGKATRPAGPNTP